jgi:hypothetical protein
MPTDKTTLGVLAGCPTGASEHALAMLGIGRAQLDRLAAAGHAVPVIRTFSNPRGMRVTWFRITDAGRAQIKRKESDR